MAAEQQVVAGHGPSQRLKMVRYTVCISTCIQLTASSNPPVSVPDVCMFAYRHKHLALTTGINSEIKASYFSGDGTFKQEDIRKAARLGLSQQLLKLLTCQLWAWLSKWNQLTFLGEPMLLYGFSTSGDISSWRFFPALVYLQWLNGRKLAIWFLEAAINKR